MASVGEALGPGRAPSYLPQLASVGPQIRRVLFGLFLILAFSATGAVLLFVLTAQQLQNSIASPNLATVKTSIGAIRQDVASVEYYYKVLDVISQKQGDAEQGLSAANVSAQTALARMTSKADDIAAFINQNYTAFIKPPLTPIAFVPATRSPAAVPSQDVTAEASQGGSPPAAPFAQLPVLDFGSDVVGYFAQYESRLAAADGNIASARAGLDTFRRKVNDQLRDYASAHATYDTSMSMVQSYRGQLAGLTTQKKQLDDAVAPKGSALDNSDYWNLCEDFYSFKTLVGDFAYNIVLLPKMMLVLTLAIFMGVLGSLIYISQDYLNSPDGRTFWDILFRIGLGAGVACALFFFAAAGMLAMTQSQTQNGQIEMSPYLISFLGITGGYLSDRTTQWMRQIGENALKVDTGAPARWAMGLGAALTAASLTTAALAGATGATPDEAEAWAALKKPVPGEKQPLIAAFLRMHPSQLFTDIAPA